MWRAVLPFVGVIDGVEKPFPVGADITEAEAKSLGLKGKPELAEQQKEAKRGPETQTA